MAAKIFRINYKSDFILTMNSDAGWAIPFCIKFWTSVPSRAYFVGFDGTTYTHCAYDQSEPTKLVVQFDDHHLPIGDLNYQIAYHFTVSDFPNDTEDEVINPAAITTEIDGDTYHVMLDFTGETAPEIEFNLPAYANEAERIQNELQRQQNEADRIAAELQREQATAAAVQGAENVNAQLSGTTLTVTNRLGVSTSVDTKGEQGAQGPVGPEGPQGETGISIVSFLPKSETSTTLIYTITYSNGHTQDVAIPKGPKGDTGATGPTGPQGPQGDTGVSITGFVETGETETDTLYNITFSNGTTQQVAIPKGEKGDQGPAGPTGPQGPMGDVAVITPEQQAAFTMYSEPGQHTNGPMTQKAVTDALDEIDDELTIYEFLKEDSLTCGASNARFYAPLTNGMVYKIVIWRVSGSNNIGVYAYESDTIGNNIHVDIGNLLSTDDSNEFVWVCNGYQYIGIYSRGSSATAKISIYAGDRKLSDKVANIPETVINFAGIRSAVLDVWQAININMDIAVNDIFKVSVSDFGDVTSYSISTWSEEDRGGTQLESFTNITDPEKIITIGTAAKCLRVYANGTQHSVLPGNFVVSKGTEMSITDAFAYVFGNLSIIPSRETAPSVLSNGMIWLEVGDGMVVHIVSDSVTDTSSTFTDELGNMIVCSSVSKDGDYLSLSSQNSALELPSIVLGEAFSMFMKFKLKNNTQTSCYIAIFNNETTAHSQFAFIYNYKNTSSMLQLHIDGVTHNSITLSDTNVHELFVKYENTVITVYLDGVQVQTFSQNIIQPTSAVNILGNSLSKTHPCAMDLREFRLYNRAVNIEDLDV